MNVTVAHLFSTIGRLQVETDCLRQEVTKWQAEATKLSAIAGDMHRKLQELDPEAARSFAIGVDSKPPQDGTGL